MRIGDFVAMAFHVAPNGCLGAEGGIGDDIAKPMWTRWATFDREMAKVEDAEVTVNGHLWVFVQKLNKGSPPQAAGYFRREPIGGSRVASGTPGLAS